MGGDCVARIEKLENGYTVEVVDEDQRKKNNDPKSKEPWADPWKTYAFSTAEEVKEFIGTHLDALKPPPDADEEFSSAFAKDAATSN